VWTQVSLHHAHAREPFDDLRMLEIDPPCVTAAMLREWDGV